MADISEVRSQFLKEVKPATKAMLGSVRSALNLAHLAIEIEFVNNAPESEKPGNEYEIDDAWIKIQDGLATLEAYADKM
jgi:hypothetical protein